MVVWILGALFAVYVLATLWQFRRTLAVQEPRARLRESIRAMILVSLGVPLLVAWILVAL